MLLQLQTPFRWISNFLSIEAAANLYGNGKGGKPKQLCSDKDKSKKKMPKIFNVEKKNNLRLMFETQSKTL